MIKWIKGLFKKEELQYVPTELIEDMRHISEVFELRFENMIRHYEDESKAMDMYAVMQSYGLFHVDKLARSIHEQKGNVTEKFLYC